MLGSRPSARSPPLAALENRLDVRAGWSARGLYASTLARIARVDVFLVLDDLLLTPMQGTARRDLLEVIEDRYDRCSTVITSQLPTKTWHEAPGDPTIADAICDRLLHNAHVLSLRGPSMRKKKGLAPSQPETTT